MRTLWQIIAGFFKGAWRLINFIRELLLNLFVLLLVLICVGIGLQFKSINTPAEVQQGALNLNLSGVIVDKPSVSDKLSKIGRQLLGASSDRLKENALFDVVESIRQAQTDNNITGIVLDLKNFIGGDQPSLQYIGKALREFRSSGKPIYAVGDNYSQAQYYLASFASKIYLSPQGSVDLHGFATHALYYRSLLDKLKVSSHVFRVGTYKSAVEPFLRDDMSPEARDASSRWVNELWRNFINQLATNRQLTSAQIFPGAGGLIAALQKTGGDTARYALETRLVDELASPASVNKQLSKFFGWDQKKRDYRGTSIYDYALKPHQEKGNMAVIFASGTIMDGQETTGTVGGDTIAAQIRQARLDPDIKAIVLRVNSPGGSVTASETIRQALTAVREAGKPLVVSMGGMAASGGYWISTPANYIIASPGTLTGSIGIFGVINTVEDSLREIGVHTDGIATSPLADVTTTKALPQEVQQMMRLSIEYGYKNFLSLVAKSRNKTPEQIDQIAQGRVWIGSDARANGLVDALGDFDDAIAKAAALAKLEKPELQWFQGDPSFTDLLLSQVNASVRALLPVTLQSLLPVPMYDVISAVQKQPGLFDNLNDPQNRYAICLLCGDVR